MMNGTPFRAPTLHQRRWTASLAGTLLLLFGVSSAAAQPPVATPPAVAPPVGTSAAESTQDVMHCPPSPEERDKFRKRIDDYLPTKQFWAAINKIESVKKNTHDCPQIAWDCYFATYYSFYSDQLSRKGEPGAQESWGKTLDYADKCIASGAIDPGGSEYGSAEEIRVIKSQAESHVGPSTQPAYRRDVKLSVVFGVAGLAMLLGGAISYAVLERQPFMLKMSDCMPSSGFRDEACGTRLYGLTGSLMGVGSAAVAVAVGFGIKLVSSPKSYLPKDTPTPEDAAARGGAR